MCVNVCVSHNDGGEGNGDVELVHGGDDHGGGGED